MADWRKERIRIAQKVVQRVKEFDRLGLVDQAEREVKKLIPAA